MKKLIITTAIAACLALCAAVWPQTETVEETPTPPTAPAVSAQKAPVAEPRTEVETAPLAEKEVEIPKQDSPQKIPAEPEPASIEAPAVPKVQPTPEPKPTPEPTPDPSPSQTVIEPQPGDMVYVEGFGWIESQGPNHIEYAEDMYENGNKIGIMG